jgi:hypothetical protein
MINVEIADTGWIIRALQAICYAWTVCCGIGGMAYLMFGRKKRINPSRSLAGRNKRE